MLAAGLISVFIVHLRFHPNQSVYFNALVGGPRGAFAKFELDYWGNCILEAVEWTAETARLSGRGVSISGNPWELVELDSERFKTLSFVPPHRPHDLHVRLNRGGWQDVTELAAREDALYRVQTADGAVLCMVFPGPTFLRLQPHLSLPPSQSDHQ
jgi:hypothetical protein